MTSSVLLVYGSKFGHTARIADRIARSLRDAACTVTAFPGRDVPANLDIDAFDGVVIAASVIRGRHQRAVQRFVASHRLALNLLPGAFYSVSGAAASPVPEEAAQAQHHISQFLAGTGWKPVRTFALAGEVAYTRYDPVTRFILKRISRRSGLSTDTSRDHDYTDWARVVSSARAFAALVAQLKEADAIRGLTLEPATA